MNTNLSTVEKLYRAFAKKQPEVMATCYHEKATFQDPVFGELDKTKTCKMWAMLLANKESPLELVFEVKDENGIRVEWTAQYQFGKNKREVINHVSSSFEFEDGLIIRQVDEFDLKAWSKMAIGLPGILFGNMAWFQQKIRDKAANGLQSFINQSKA